MSYVTVPGGFHLPPYHSRLSGGFGASSIGVIDAAGERVGYVFVVPETGTIDRLVFRTGTVTTSQSLDVSIETTDATTGFPTGTNYGSSTPGTQASVASNTLYEVTLGTGATATAGDVVALVIDFTSTVGNINLACFAGTRDMNQGFPYGVLYTAAWAKQSDANLTPLFGVRYNDGTYKWCGGGLAGTINSGTTFNNGSTPDEVASKIITVAPMRAAGFWIVTNPASSSATFDVVLYNSASTALATTSIDPDQLQGTGSAKLIYHRFALPQQLAAGTYRLALKPTSANNVSYTEWVVSSNAMLGCNIGGTNCYKSTRTDGGAWTDTDTTQLPMMGLWIDQIDDGTGSGGLKTLMRSPLLG